MKKLAILLIMLLVMESFSFGQINSIEIKDVNVNDNAIQVLVENNFDKDFIKETFIINNQYTIIQDELFSNFTTKFFIVNYPTGIKLETLMAIVGDKSTDYVFTGEEDGFIFDQVTSQTLELAQVESNSPISYIYSAGRVAKIQDNNIIYLSSDNVGSTSIETDSLGNINFKSNYLPFGKELSFSSIGKEKYGFTGKEYDYEGSLNYFNARYYNPSNGKFISNDPIFKPTEGGYQYVNNNPLTITDPSGMQDEAYGKPTIESNSKSGIIFRRDYGKQINEDMSIHVDFTSALSDDGEVDPPLDISPSRVIILEMVTKESVKKKYGPLVARRGGYRKITSKALKHINQKFFSEGNLAVVPPGYNGGGIPLVDVDLLERVIIFIEEVLRPNGFNGRIISGLRTDKDQGKQGNPNAADPGKSTHNKGMAVDISVYDERGRLIDFRSRRILKDPKAIEVNSLLEENLPNYGLIRRYAYKRLERNHIELDN